MHTFARVAPVVEFACSSLLPSERLRASSSGSTGSSLPDIALRTGEFECVSVALNDVSQVGFYQ